MKGDILISGVMTCVSCTGNSAKSRGKGKTKQKIQQSAIITAYNRGMGGVDLLDRALSDLRPVIRGKMWYCP